MLVFFRCAVRNKPNSSSNLETSQNYLKKHEIIK